MVETLKAEIKILKDKKEELRGIFYEYELAEHISMFTELRAIDLAVNILNKLLVKVLEEKLNV